MADLEVHVPCYDAAAGSKGVPMMALIDNAVHWHDRAKEMRARVGQTTDPTVKKTLLDIAERCEDLALRADERLARALIGKK